MDGLMWMERQMPANKLKTLEVSSRGHWRAWLQMHHAAEAEIWLVFHKRHTAKQSISYDDAIDEALCFGWVDSLVKRLDDDRYARKFTPRKPDSRWSTINRQRYSKLRASGLLAAPGLARPPTNKSGDAPRPSLAAIPSFIETELKANARAWDFFQQLSPSCRRAYLGWIASAKREETQQKRLREAITLLAAGQKLGLK
jgi:uncharacterized protein YdeI (YjbR/CyaY-like superfamily)